MIEACKTVRAYSQWAFALASRHCHQMGTTDFCGTIHIKWWQTLKEKFTNLNAITYCEWALRDILLQIIVYSYMTSLSRFNKVLHHFHVLHYFPRWFTRKLICVLWKHSCTLWSKTNIITVLQWCRNLKNWYLQVVLDLTFSLSSNELISVSKDGTVAFWDLSSGERNRVLDVSSLGSSMRTKVLQSTNGMSE